MRERSTIAMMCIIALAYTGITLNVDARNQPGELLEYQVISLQPSTWVVTAKETASGEVVKFKLPPSVFVGKSFDADLNRVEKGKRFNVRGQKNARINQLKLEKAQFGPTPRIKARARFNEEQDEALPWIITQVDALQWVVTAKNRHTNKVAKFRVHPDAFNGFRFKANLQGIKQGEGFSILTPNNAPMNNIATLMDIQK